MLCHRETVKCVKSKLTITACTFVAVKSVKENLDINSNNTKADNLQFEKVNIMKCQRTMKYAWYLCSY